MAQLLRHCTTNRKVAGSILDGVRGFFQWHNPVGRTKRNEYQEYFLGGKRGRCLGLTALPPSCVDCLEIWEPRPPGTVMEPCNGIALPCFYHPY
jgi:hypothetical protein